MKAAVEHPEQTFGFSERRACRLIGLPASTFRYQSKSTDEPLRTQLVDLAQETPRFGYWRLHVLLRSNGVEANDKRVWRIYQEAGLALKRKKRERLVREGKPRDAAVATDVLATGRSVRALSIVDTFTRECVTLEVDTSFACRRPLPSPRCADPALATSLRCALTGGANHCGANSSPKLVGTVTVGAAT